MMWFNVFALSAIAAPTLPPADFPVTGDVIVRMAPGVDPAILHDLGDVRLLGGWPEVALLRPTTATDPTALAQALDARSDVVWAEPDMILPVALHDLPNDPLLPNQWHLENTGQNGRLEGVDINAEAAWALSTGEGGLVAVLDSGVDLSHPDLRVTPGFDYNQNDYDPSPGEDQNAHGTACAGLAAGIGDNGLGVAGVAYDAEVYAIRFIGGDTSLSDIYNAWIESVDAGAWVISNSWGIPDCPAYETPQSILDAYAYAEDVGRDGLGTVTVFSAGNSNCDGSNDGLLTPERVITVAASNGRDVRHGYSNYGNTLDITAPAGGLVTTDITGESGYGEYLGDADYYGDFGGTSSAAPLVSGVVTLMFSANPRLTAAQARDILCETAVKIDVESGAYDDTGFSTWYGCGRLDAAAAVEAVANLAAPDAPALIFPLNEANIDRVLLQWDPAVDADGDALRYTVSWWLDSDPDDIETIEVDGLSLDISDEVGLDDTIGWTVHATDAWGPGLESDPATFTVVDTVVPEPTEPRGGCAVAVGPTSGGLLALMALFTRRRRRDQYDG
ncbi:MAG: S8 family serine peptidase [Myxococcota bacterium]